MVALGKRGEARVEGRSQKYVTFTRREGGYYFLGRSGSLRVGHASSRSIPASDAFKAALLASFCIIIRTSYR